MTPLRMLGPIAFLLVLCALLVSRAVSGSFDSCADCHEEAVLALQNSPHAEAVGIADCGSCHGNLEAHAAEPSTENVVRPLTASPAEALELCSSCHFTDAEGDYAHAGEHFRAGVSCFGCHNIHGGQGPSLLTKASEEETCYNCHDRQRRQFSMSRNHPLSTGVVTCSSCHRIFSRLDFKSGVGDPNEACYECHGEYEGPFVYEHDPVRDYGVEGGGCMNCHDAHGSPNISLLKAPVSRICQQCHVVPGHQTAHGGLFQGYDCRSCHADLHGSNTSEDYFVTGTVTETCFECHSGRIE